MAPPDSITHVLARPEQDAIAALQALADELGAPKNAPIVTGTLMRSAPASRRAASPTDWASSTARRTR